MKLLSTAIAAIAGFGIVPASTQAETQFCFEFSDGIGSIEVYAGHRFDKGPSPSYISGENPGSRVNVRTGPGIEYPTMGIYGLVGEEVTSIGFGYDRNCQLWFKVRFPTSQQEGWIHDDYLEPAPGHEGGLFT